MVMLACCSSFFSIGKRIVGPCVALRVASAPAQCFLSISKGLHVGRRDLAGRMPYLGALLCPIVRAAAGFHLCRGRRQGSEERQELVAPQPLAEDN